VRAPVRPDPVATSPSTAGFHDDLLPSQELAGILRTERERLAEAQSVLACVHLALVYADPEAEGDPDCAKAVAIALSLVRETAHRLDAARVTRDGEDGRPASPRRKALPPRR